MISDIAIPFDEIADFCSRHHIRKLSLFGSVLREDFRPDSDIDVLVEYEPEYVPGFIHVSAIRREISEIMGREVDLRTSASLSDYFRAQVETDAILVYECNRLLHDKTV